MPQIILGILSEFKVHSVINGVLQALGRLQFWRVYDNYVLGMLSFGLGPQEVHTHYCRGVVLLLEFLSAKMALPCCQKMELL